MQQFNRYWELKITAVDNKFRYVLKPNEAGQSLRISFEVNVATDIRYYTATIKIWNLHPDKRQSLNFNLLLDEFGKGPRVELTAGYQERSGVIFDGAVLRGYPVRDSLTGNWITVLQCGIPIQQSKQVTIQQKVVNNGTLYSYILAAVEKLLSQPDRAEVRFSSSFEDNLKTAVNKYTAANEIDKALGYQGTTTFILDEISKEFNLYFFYGKDGFNVISGNYGSDKSLLIIPAGEPPEIIFDGSLKQIIGSPVYTDTGARITSYLRPELRMFQHIRVKSRILDRNVSISSLKHRGDSRSNEWYSEIDAVNINQLLRR